MDDDEKGGELPYVCNYCGYEGSRVVRIKKFEPVNGDPNNTRIVMDLVPDGLVGITGSFIGGTY